MISISWPIASYLTDADSQLDIDGDGESKPLTDGRLLIRYLFGFSGDSLVSGAIGSDATRTTAEAVEKCMQHDGDKLHQAYQSSNLLEIRLEIMNKWAAWCNGEEV